MVDSLRLALAVENTFNNCCVALVDERGDVRFERNALFRAPIDVSQGSAAWDEALLAFHAATLPRLLEEALARVDAAVDVVALGGVSGPSANVALARRVLAGRLLGRAVVEVDHVVAHAVVSCLGDDAPALPFVSLTVAGGHTQLALVRSPLALEVLGSHANAPRNRHGHGRAAGAVLDRCAVLLGTVDRDQPDGAIAIDRLSQRIAPAAPERFADTARANRENGLDFDFHRVYDEAAAAVAQGDDPARVAVAAQEAVMEVLAGKALAAAARCGVPRLCIGGGVAANSRLRALLAAGAAQRAIHLWAPPPARCADNAVMIAVLALLQAGAQAERRAS